MHYLLILLTAPSCHWYQNYLPFHSLESVKETKKENSTNQFALIDSILLYTLYTVKKKRNELELYQKFVYYVAQKFLQDFNFFFLADIFRESCFIGGLLQLQIQHAVAILQNYRGTSCRHDHLRSAEHHG